MKRIVVLNGSPHKAGRTMALVNEVLKEASEKETTIKTYNLNSLRIKGCQSCLGCKKEGVCVINDDMQSIYKDINEADSIIFATPVFMWQMTAQLKLFIDRLSAYLKQDFTSFLSSKKNFMFVVSCGGGNILDYTNYFEYSSKSLQLLGFGEYKIFIVGGGNSLEEFIGNKETLAEAYKYGKWLLEA